MEAKKKEKIGIAEWAPGFQFRVDASVAYLELRRITKDAGEQIDHARQIVFAAQPPKSPLHDEFEWNDHLAAKLHRERTARKLLHGIRVWVDDPDVDGEEILVRAFVHIDRTTEHDDEGFYVTTIRAADDVELHSRVLVTAIRDVKSWRDRYRELKELRTIFGLIDELK